MKNIPKQKINRALAAALWQIYHREADSLPWEDGADFPWHDPDFGRRALAEHLDESNAAASRTSAERLAQIDWLWATLKLRPGMHLLDVTCGPGLYAVELAKRGCAVTGIDINPAAIAYATELAARQEVSAWCTFIQQDIREMELEPARFDAALFLYEQLAVVSKPEARHLLATIARALKPGAPLCVELLDQAHVDQTGSSWWFTDDTGLWGDSPFLQLGERIWDEELAASIERYYLIHLETGQLKAYTLFDQTYPIAEMVSMMQQAGFASVDVFPHWAGLPLYDAREWVVYVAHNAA